MNTNFECGETKFVEKLTIGWKEFCICKTQKIWWL